MTLITTERPVEEPLRVPAAALDPEVRKVLEAVRADFLEIDDAIHRAYKQATLHPQIVALSKLRGRTAKTYNLAVCLLEQQP